MCGIAGVYLKDPSVVRSHAGFESFVDHLFLGIEHRGRQASGFVAVTDGGLIAMDKADKPAKDFIKDREALPENTKMVLLHTRYATKGSVTNQANNHPVIYNSCFTTHNGSVENDDELFDEYKFERRAEVDSEIIPALIEKVGFDPEELSKTFKGVLGPIACATINPIRYPNKVLLLRTKSSPLNIIETSKFIVWASETKAMRDAWASVLGTPPKWEKFKFIPEYKCMILDENGMGGTYPLERPPFRPQEFGFRSPDGTRRETANVRTPTRTNGRGDSPFDSMIAASDVGRLVRGQRNLGRGKATTYKTNNAHYGSSWKTCTICTTLVANRDLIDTLNRGKMCVDCADMYNTLYRDRMAEAEEKKDDTDDTDDTPDEFPTEEYMTPVEINRLNLWAEDEDVIHKLVLESMGQKTGLSAEALDFILNRMPLEKVKTNTKIHKMLEKLWPMYDEMVADQWAEMDDGGSTGIDYYKFILKIQEPQKPKEQKALPAGKGILKNANAEKRIKVCLFCRSKRRFAISRDGEAPFHYCNKHYTECSVKGCNTVANHTRTEGVRVCHTHARGHKNCHSDTFLTENGYTLEEAK